MTLKGVDDTRPGGTVDVGVAIRWLSITLCVRLTVQAELVVRAELVFKEAT